MQSLMRIFIDVFVVAVVVALCAFVYVNYREPIIDLFTEGTEIIFVGDLAVEVTIADDQQERLRGLSDTESLEELEGKLFIFDSSDNYGIWMKDMNFPIDIIWISEDLEVIDLEENVSPDSYPKVFRPDQDARFVLETNAFFVKTFKVEKGQRVNLPSSILPKDIRQNLQQ